MVRLTKIVQLASRETNSARRRVNEAWIEQNEANRKAEEHGIDRPRPRNLQGDFDQAGEVYQTPSANLAVAAS